MNLQASIAMNFGGPGSGCNPAVGKCGRPTGSGGEAFVSPSVAEGLNLRQAVTRLNSKQQQSFLQRANQVMSTVSPGGTAESAVGAWADGAENSSILNFGSHASAEDINYAAAKLGMEANQKAVLSFARSQSGPDTMWSFTAQGSMDGVQKSLLNHGIEYHTLEPRGDSVKVTVFDQGSKLTDGIMGVASEYKTDIYASRGTGNFIGGDTREEGQSAFSQVVNDYERRYGIHATHHRRDGQRRWGGYRGSFRLAQAEELACVTGEPESAGTSSMGHLNVIPSFHPPSLRKPYHIPVPEDERETDNMFLDVSKRREKLMNLIKRAKESGVPDLSHIPVTTTQIGIGNGQ